MYFIELGSNPKNHTQADRDLLATPHRSLYVFCMWKLRRRDYVVKEWAEHGDFKSIADAVTRINEMEGKRRYESLFLSVYVDPTGALPSFDTDAGILSRLEFRTAKHFYLLEHWVQ